ncbi:isoflavone reductase [Xylariales sp. PMI_506]|nr:isoflavone reductase [Xylariales sp. PMI_506]
MSKRSTTAMMHIAIAGGGGFASILLQELAQSAHALLVLSTRPHPEFESEYDCRVAEVDFLNNMENLRFALQGVDIVISTISGTEQVNLIDAARRSRVSCFVPSEFEGALNHRPTDDPIDRGSRAALDLLRRWSSSKSSPMRFTVFSCGLFYERFAPGGLAAYNMGSSWNIPNQGDYLVDLGACTAEIPQTNSQGRQVHITLTSVYDVARFIAAAIEMGIDHWPREFKMRGAHVTTQRLVEICQEVRGVEITTISRPYQELLDWLQYYEQTNDGPKWYQMIHMIQTANGRYHFSDANLNELVNVQPIGLRPWLEHIWGPAV